MRKKNPKHDYRYFMTTDNGRVTIDHDSVEKDLGVTFVTDLNFDKHLINIISKANKMLGIIRRSFTYLEVKP